ncbi:MAG TPA: hypothetical protein VFR86_11690 [Burkholderiaceae bacterium]|nr:hypothetical protein [Burkholderiaceae bacterium]
MFAQRFACDIQLVLDLIEDGAGNTNAAAGGKSLQAWGNVDALPEDLSAFDDDVADVDPDAKLHSSFGGKTLVAQSERPLKLNGTLHRVHRTWELGQEAVSRRVDDAPAMLFDMPASNLEISRQPLQRADLVLAHEAAVALDIGAENRRQFACEGLG